MHNKRNGIVASLDEFTIIFLWDAALFVVLLIQSWYNHRYIGSEINSLY